MGEYSIGLDLGTNSSGIAVIDEEFKLVKYKNKNIWSVMKFDAGETAAARRNFRGARRLLVRRKKRINNLRILLEEEIIKSDESFFQRLEDSFKHKEDRVNKEDKYNLFIEEKFNDKDYFNKYPTIYHLREELIKDSSKKDIRLVYLALHHIVKYRGNFLYEGEDLKSVSGNNKELIDRLGNMCDECLELKTNFDSGKISEILIDKNKSRKDKVKEIVSLESYSKEDKQSIEQIFNGVLGLVMNLSKFQFECDLGDLGKIQMSDEAIEEKINILSDMIGEPIEIIEQINKIYTKVKLDDILDGQLYISEAMTKKFNKFKLDLALLKKVIRENCTDKVYKAMFKSKEIDKVNYGNYMNSCIKLKEKTPDAILKAFYDEIRNLLKEIENEDVKYILSEIENDNFLRKINITSNSVIPYQVHLEELDKILNNQGKYYSCLKESKEKIKSILTFRIPYYVGPLSKVKTEFSWMSKYDGKENEKIYPWNFKDIVDINKSAEDFITRMTSYCSYIPSEPVLPFNSILYTEYLYYTEINKIRFNDRLLDNNLKEELKQELFMSKNNVTEKDLILWYKRKNALLGSSDIKVTGFMGDKKVNATLKPIRNFTTIYGKITNENIKEIERIIYYLTVFEDKNIVKNKLDIEFRLTDDQKKKIMQLKYTGWGKLSKRLLEDLKVTKVDCSKVTIMDELKNTNLNFMQIINDDMLGFNKKIEEINGSDKIEKVNYDKHIKTLQGSPALKKAIYQATKQIEEVIKITGEYPKNIYVEVAKEDQESKRTLARNSKVLEMYELISDLTQDDKDIIKKLNNKKFKIDTEKMYLYILQRGKCMYSEKSLDIENLWKYEVDHIIPRSLIKDDSISNKVLVFKEYNQKKASGALEEKIINERRRFWADLLKYKLISKRKYDNLVNYSGSFSKEAEKGFINRQLVEVRQITKHVVNLLNRIYGDKGTKVYAIKAELADNFKKQLNIYKNRDINDLHHAKDAYAVAVVGQYINRRFKSLDSEFIYNDYKVYSKKATNKNKFGFIISSMLFDYVDEEGVVIWESQEEIAKIKKIFGYNDVLVVKKTEIITGQMFNLTRYKKPSEGTLKVDKIPLRNSKNEYLAPEKYGYYEGVQESYYSIIEYTDKKKRVKRIVGVPVMYSDKFKNNESELQKYFNEKGYKDTLIIKDRVPKYQKIELDGNEFYLVSSKEWQNAKQLKLSQKYYDYICILNDNRNLYKLKTEEIEVMIKEVFDVLLEKLEYNYSIYNNIVKKVRQSEEKFVQLDILDRIKVINEILKLSKASSECANLKLIEGADREGRLGGKGNIDVNKIKFIYESYLGINKREVKY